MSIEDKRRVLAKYTLTLTHDVPGFQQYRLGPDARTGMGVVTLQFTSAPLTDRIVITGDLCPGDNGVISNAGYGIDWFGSPKSGGYLCEKFIREDYHTEVAQRWLRGHIAEMERELAEDEPDDATRAILATRLEASREALDDDDMGSGGSPLRHAEAFYDWFHETFDDGPDGAGSGYDPDVAGWLCAIQEKFAELYQAQNVVAA